MNNIPILLFFIYSAFSVNLLLQCGLGIKGAVESKNIFNLSVLIKISIVFFTIIMLWLFFSKVLFSLLPGVYIYILVFPVSFISYNIIEYLIICHLLKKGEQHKSSIYFP